jgi:hypothetical protein
MDRRRYATANELGTFAFCPRAWFYETECGRRAFQEGSGRPDPRFEKGREVHARLQAYHMGEGPAIAAKHARARFPFAYVVLAVGLVFLGSILWMLLLS